MSSCCMVNLGHFFFCIFWMRGGLSQTIYRLLSCFNEAKDMEKDRDHQDNVGRSETARDILLSNDLIMIWELEFLFDNTKHGFQMQQKSAKQQQRICACLDRINQCFSSNSLDDGRAVEVEGDGCELWEYHPELSHVTTSNGYVFHIFCRRFADFSVLRFGQRWFDEIHWECEMEKTHRFVHTLDKHETAVAKLKTQKNLKLITIFFQKLFEKNDEQLHRWFIWLHFQVAGDQVYTVDWYRLGHANTL